MSKYSAVLICSLPFNLVAMPSLYAVYDNTSWYDKNVLKSLTEDDAYLPNSKTSERYRAGSICNLSDSLQSSIVDENLSLSQKEIENNSTMDNDMPQTEKFTAQITDFKDNGKMNLLRNTVFQPKMILVLSLVAYGGLSTFTCLTSWLIKCTQRN